MMMMERLQEGNLKLSSLDFSLFTFHFLCETETEKHDFLLFLFLFLFLKNLQGD